MGRRHVGIATAAGLLIGVLHASWAHSQIVPGSLNVRWQSGAHGCTPPEQPIQVHAYERQTYILRQSLCADFEGNFLYLLVGSKKALLIDTGAVSDVEKMPLARTVLALLPRTGSASFPLLVVHTHQHSDHYAGDAQFVTEPSVRVVPAGLQEVRAFFGFRDWPEGVAFIDLGDRMVHVIPSPGHESAHLVFYDERTAILFSGDFLLPGRIIVADTRAFRESARRLVRFVQTHELTYILGGHIEMDTAGNLYSHGSTSHPNERPLQLVTNDLLELSSALDTFNGFYTRRPNFVLTHPVHNLIALASLVISGVFLTIWGVQHARRRRRAIARRTPV